MSDMAMVVQLYCLAMKSGECCCRVVLLLVLWYFTGFSVFSWGATLVGFMFRAALAVVGFVLRGVLYLITSHIFYYIYIIIGVGIAIGYAEGGLFYFRRNRFAQPHQRPIGSINGNDMSLMLRSAAVDLILPFVVSYIFLPTNVTLFMTLPMFLASHSLKIIDMGCQFSNQALSRNEFNYIFFRNTVLFMFLTVFISLPFQLFGTNQLAVEKKTYLGRIAESAYTYLSVSEAAPSNESDIFYQSEQHYMQEIWDAEKVDIPNKQEEAIEVTEQTFSEYLIPQQLVPTTAEELSKQTTTNELSQQLEGPKESKVVEVTKQTFSEQTLSEYLIPQQLQPTPAEELNKQTATNELNEQQEDQNEEQTIEITEHTFSEYLIPQQFQQLQPTAARKLSHQTATNEPNAQLEAKGGL